MSELSTVWTPAAVISAVVGGLGIGYFVLGQILRDPRYSSGQASPRDVWRLVVRGAALVGFGFYIGQVVATSFEAGGDFGWRVISRFLLWLLYSLLLAVGAAWSIRNDDHDRYLQARDQARSMTPKGRNR